MTACLTRLALQLGQIGVELFQAFDLSAKDTLMGGHARSDYVVRSRDKTLWRISRNGSMEPVVDLASVRQTVFYKYIFGEQNKAALSLGRSVQ